MAVRARRRRPLVTASQSEIPPRPIGWGFSISINSKERNWTSRTRASRAW
nr:MAG TPA: hypothetical protein [Caudoviricetes sp.]